MTSDEAKALCELNIDGLKMGKDNRTLRKIATDTRIREMQTEIDNLRARIRVLEQGRDPEK
jgi:hypothetical protein